MKSLKHSSFYLPLRLLRAPKRNAITNLYEFFYTVDQAIDTAKHTDEALQAVTFWRNEVLSIYHNRKYTHSVSQSLAEVIACYNLPHTQFDEFLDGVAMDAEGIMVAPSHDTLHRYCYRVASVVGLLSLPIFGATSKESQSYAITLGHALQRTNIARDIIEDARTGRLYLASEWLNITDEHCVSPTSVITNTQSYYSAMQHLLQEANTYFLETEKMFSSLKNHEKKVLVPTCRMHNIYFALWKKLHAKNAIMPHRVSLNFFDKIHAML